MYILYSLIILVLFLILSGLTSIRPIRGRYSKFELERRANQDDMGAVENLAREDMLGDIISFQRILVGLLLVIITLISIACYGWLIGIIVSISLALFSESISRIGFLGTFSKKLYDRFERSILKFIRKNPIVIKLFRGIPVDEGLVPHKIESRDELRHLIDESDHILSFNEKKLVLSSINFNDILIKSIMTPRDKIITIDRSEFLGPLALNDLHKAGHNHLPVVGDDVNNIIGILNLKELLALDTKKSMTAEKAMDSKVCYIHENQTLYQGLTAFSHTHQHLLIVVNKSGETVGVLVLKDVIEALIGRKIVDEFDDYDSLRAVSARK